MEAGRAALLAKIGAPADTRTKLAALIAADKSGLLEWVLRGGKAVDEPQIRSLERQSLEAKAVTDSHAAEVAGAALEQAEFELEVLNRKMAALEPRRQKFVNAAVAEAAAPAAERLREQIAAVRETYVEWCAMKSATTGTSSATIALPRLGAPGMPAAIEITDDDARRAAGPWHDLARALTADPRASLNSKGA